ncbi:MAG: hypothetical protein FJ319_12940 [SAR202 cluster bacterium]|nr:hypothetical protein [SAR202 cluster bacterium]
MSASLTRLTIIATLAVCALALAACDSVYGASGKVVTVEGTHAGRVQTMDPNGARDDIMYPEGGTRVQSAEVTMFMELLADDSPDWERPTAFTITNTNGTFHVFEVAGATGQERLGIEVKHPDFEPFRATLDSAYSTVYIVLAPKATSTAVTPGETGN